MDQHASVIKHGLDLAAAMAALGTFAGWLPSIASAMAIAWYVARFYEWWKARK